MLRHRKSLSQTSLDHQKQKLDRIILDCLKAKKEISGNFSKINKQLFSQRSEYKSVQNYIKTQQNIKPDHGFAPSKELHDKFQAICDKQKDRRAMKMSKFLCFNKEEPITDKDLIDQDTLKFFSVNRRSFGSPVNEILYTNKKKPKKVQSCDISINPEETVLKDIFELKARKAKARKVNNRKNFERKPNDDRIEEEVEIIVSELNSKNKIIYKEMKKIDPVNLNIYMRKRNRNGRGSDKKLG